MLDQVRPGRPAPGWAVGLPIPARSRPAMVLSCSVCFLPTPCAGPGMRQGTLWPCTRRDLIDGKRDCESEGHRGESDWGARMPEKRGPGRPGQEGEGSGGPGLEAFPSDSGVFVSGMDGSAQKGADADEVAREAWLVQMVREVRFPADGPRRCPRCRSPQTIRWGRFKQRQRYMCRSCGRTFSDLTGTPFAHSKRLGLWLTFGECMATGCSVRASARKLGVNKDTAFRWRHRLAAVYDRPPASPMAGMWGVWDAMLPHSYKGRRPPDRASRRKRGRLLDPLRPSHMHVIFFCSKEDSDWEFVTVRSSKIFPTDDELEEHIGALFSPGTRLVVPIHRCASFAAFAWTHRQEIFDPAGRHRPSWEMLNRSQKGRIRARQRGLTIPSERGEGAASPSSQVSRSEAAGSVDSTGIIDKAATGGLCLSDPDSSRRTQALPRRSPEDMEQGEARAIHAEAWGLRQGWKRWMRRFRGVASRYLRSYLAWYRQLLTALEEDPYGLAIAFEPRPLEPRGLTDSHAEVDSATDRERPERPVLERRRDERMAVSAGGVRIPFLGPNSSAAVIGTRLIADAVAPEGVA